MESLEYRVSFRRPGGKSEVITVTVENVANARNRAKYAAAKKLFGVRRAMHWCWHRTESCRKVIV